MSGFRGLSVAVWVCLLVYLTSADLYDEALASNLANLDNNYIDNGPLLYKFEDPRKGLLLQKFVQPVGSVNDKIYQPPYGNKYDIIGQHSNQMLDSDQLTIMKRASAEGPVPKTPPKVKPVVKAPSQNKKGKPARTNWVCYFKLCSFRWPAK